MICTSGAQISPMWPKKQIPPVTNSMRRFVISQRRFQTIGTNTLNIYAIWKNIICNLHKYILQCHLTIKANSNFAKLVKEAVTNSRRRSLTSWTLRESVKLNEYLTVRLTPLLRSAICNFLRGFRSSLYIICELIFDPKNCSNVQIVCKTINEKFHLI